MENEHLLNTKNKSPRPFKVRNGVEVEIKDEVSRLGRQIGHNLTVGNDPIKEFTEKFSMMVQVHRNELYLGVNEVVIQLEGTIGRKQKHTVALGEAFFENVGVVGGQVGDRCGAINHEIVFCLDSLILLVQFEGNFTDL